MPFKQVQVLAVLVTKRLVVEEGFGQDLCDAADDLPVSRAEIRAKGDAALKEENVIDDV